MGRRCTSSENRSKAGCVHQAHSRGQELARNKDFECHYSLHVSRILLFRNVLLYRTHRNICPVRSLESNASGKALTMPDDGRYGRYRDNTGRKHGVAHERIQKSRFAPLELAHTGHVKQSLGDALGDEASGGGEMLGIEFGSQLGETVESRLAFRALQYAAVVFRG